MHAAGAVADFSDRVWRWRQGHPASKRSGEDGQGQRAAVAGVVVGSALAATGPGLAAPPPFKRLGTEADACIAILRTVDRVF